jgi:hypothetical protein
MPVSSPTVIRQIDTSEAPRAAKTAAVPPATPAGKNFATHLASEKKAVRDNAPPRTAIEAPEGEVWRPVAGDDDYAKITSGPRAGQYINLSRGDRRGQTFHVEMRDGKRVHVYDKGGADEKVVAAAKDSGKVGHSHSADASAARHPGKETWAPVEGVSNYADILSGPRNGLFVNTSGGSRDGMAFQIVKHGAHTYHVYGSGKHRQMIEVGHHDTKKAASDDSGSVKDSAAAGTGGTEATG